MVAPYWSVLYIGLRTRTELWLVIICLSGADSPAAPGLPPVDSPLVIALGELVRSYSHGQLSFVLLKA